MHTVHDLVLQLAEQIKAMITDLVLSHSTLKRWNYPGSGILTVTGDYSWNPLSTEGGVFHVTDTKTTLRQILPSRRSDTKRTGVECSIGSSTQLQPEFDDWYLSVHGPGVTDADLQRARTHNHRGVATIPAKMCKIGKGFTIRNTCK